MNFLLSKNPYRMGRLSGLLFCLLSILPGGLRAAIEIPYAEMLFPEVAGLLEAAEESSQEIERQRLLLEERGSEVEVAKGLGRPRVDLFLRALGTYETRDDIDDVTRATLTGNISASQPLYRWGQVRLQKEIAGTRVEAEMASATSSVESVYRDIRRSYLRWLLAEEQSAILEKSIQLTEKYVEARRKLTEAGRVAEQQVLEMEARLLENREQLSYFSRQKEDLKRELARLTGRPDLAGAMQGGDLAGIRPVSLRKLDDLEAMFAKDEFELRIPERDRFAAYAEAEEHQADLLRTYQRPLLDFVAGVFSDQLDSINQEDSVTRVQAFAGLQVTWNIFDGWQNQARQIGAIARKRRWALESQWAETRARQQLRSTIGAVRLNVLQIEARTKRSELLERRVELLREQASKNLVSGIDLMDGEIDYQSVLQRLREAQVDYLLNMMDLGRHMEVDPGPQFELESTR